jgi:hypothetical protein
LDEVESIKEMELTALEEKFVHVFGFELVFCVGHECEYEAVVFGDLGVWEV